MIRQTFTVDSGRLSFKASSLWRFLSGNMLQLNRASNSLYCVWVNEVRSWLFFHFAVEQEIERRWSHKAIPFPLKSPRTPPLWTSHDFSPLQPGLESRLSKFPGLDSRRLSPVKFSLFLLGNVTSLIFSVLTSVCPATLRAVHSGLPRLLSHTLFLLETEKEPHVPYAWIHNTFFKMVSSFYLFIGNLVYLIWKMGFFFSRLYEALFTPLGRGS